jgi:hypothetical protein
MQIKKKLNKFKNLYIFFISYVLFIIFFSTTFLQASTFKVSDIEISEPFQLDFNKNRVIDEGFRAAFNNLISMIITSGDRTKVANVPLNQIKGMIDSFTIIDEKFVDEEYSATLEVTFNKKNTLIFLEKKSIFPSIPIRNKVLIFPILIDIELDNIFLFTNNIFYDEWNSTKKNYYLLDYLLPNEDLEDLNIIQKNYNFIEDYDFTELVKKYALEDFIITIIFKEKDKLRVLSKMNFNKSLKIDNRIFQEINLKNKDTFKLILNQLKVIYEDNWKQNNQINTSIKLPLTISIDSNKYIKIKNLQKTLNELDLVSEFYILKFDSVNTYFRIIYNGSPKIFLNDMKKKNINLTNRDNLWIVQ